MPWGECTVTLEDVAYQLGLPIDGEPVSGCLWDFENMMLEGTGKPRWDWFREMFGEPPVMKPVSTDITGGVRSGSGRRLQKERKDRNKTYKTIAGAYPYASHGAMRPGDSRIVPVTAGYSWEPGAETRTPSNTCSICELNPEWWTPSARDKGLSELQRTKVPTSSGRVNPTRRTQMPVPFGVLPSHPSDEMVLRHARAYIWMLLSICLFGDKTRAQAHVRWLPYLLRINDLGRYSWGPQCLPSCTRVFAEQQTGMSSRWYLPTSDEKGPRLQHLRRQLDLMPFNAVS
ncbi:hypothetical protein PIB30_003535 [Stylosanthes scabra]|uniref:Aminotransferase-like plant mobile domain-containing protein n=1 Tax=Stylosanthes scabra TaxID=79078 RepID=A0ABU6W2U4_9FABA|nr:hypothetical protein [Stylosanthes scabra]